MASLRRRELTYINRCAILLTPKLPYIAWANSLDTTGPRFDDTAFDKDGPAVFLIPSVDYLDDAQGFIALSTAFLKNGHKAYPLSYN